jgi:hypothetical protein
MDRELVKALQFVQGALLMLTIRPLAFVAAHELLLLAKKLKLHAYAPTCNALIDPP